MKNKILTVLSYVLVALAACILTLNAVVMQRGDDMTKLEQLYALIDGRFIGNMDEDAMADAMVEALGDRWSYYMTAEEYKSYQDQMANSYVGIGITVTLRSDGTGLDITEITPEGGADKAGLLAGDAIIRVGETPLNGLTLDEITPMIRGEEGTKVQITVLRQDKEITFQVERSRIITPVATATLLDGNIGLVKIANFDARCYEESKAAIDSLLEQGATKLIFDVRNNPGGYKKELVKLLDYLLPEGLLFRSETYDGKITDDRSDAACLELPMAVLVNGNSYSAAEFFAAALADYDYAAVVGTQTCGKGYFQNTFPLKDGSAVALSVGKYYTPKGVSLAEVGGLTPEITVEVDAATAAAIASGKLDPMEDPQILAAIEALN